MLSYQTDVGQYDIFFQHWDQEDLSISRHHPLKVSLSANEGQKSFPYLVLAFGF